MRSRLLRLLFVVVLTALVVPVTDSIAPSAEAQAASCSNYASGYTTSYKWRAGYGQSAVVYFYFGTTCDGLIHFSYLNTQVNTRDVISGLSRARVVPDHLSFASVTKYIYGGIVQPGQCKTRSFRVRGSATLGWEFLATAKELKKTKTVCY